MNDAVNVKVKKERTRERKRERKKDLSFCGDLEVSEKKGQSSPG